MHIISRSLTAAATILMSGPALAGVDCQWSALAGGGLGSNVQTLLGFGGSLYAGGDFTTAGGNAAVRIARWDGQAWSPMSAGMSSTVRALAIFDDGGGPALYAGGLFTSAGGTSGINRIAKWNAATETWSPLGSGLGSGVYSLIVFDDGSGPALYVGGAFTAAGGSPARSIARWDGQSWSPLANGTGGTVLALAVFDDGTGPGLYAGGTYATGGGGVANYIARWAGGSWSALGTGGGGTNGQIETLTVFDDGSGPALYVGGFFTSAGGVPASRIARWRSPAAGWSAVGAGVGGGVYTLAVVDDGSGPALYAGGTFSTSGSEPTSRIARWDPGSSLWMPLGSGTNNVVSAITAFDAGDGPHLYAAGAFTLAGGETAQRIARWICTDTPCYANCDNSTVEPILNVDDFTCFINEFAAAQGLSHPQQIEHYANCDGSTVAPVLNVDDFTCFINAFAAGCP